MLTPETLKQSLKHDAQSPVIDVHTHSGADHFNTLFKGYPTNQSVKDLVWKMNYLNIDYAVNFPCPSSYYYFDFTHFHKTGELIPALEPAEDYPYQLANRQLMFETALFGQDKVIPFAMVFPGVEDAKQISALNTLGKEEKLFGIKLHTLATHTKATAFADTEYLQIAEDYSVPFLIHSGPDEYSKPKHIVSLAKSYPHLRFCIAHMGRFESAIFDEVGKLNSSNLFLDTSPLLALCRMTQMENDSGSAEPKLETTFDDPQEALLYAYSLYSRGILWGSDEPWTTFTFDDTGALIQNINYEDEKKLLDSLPVEVQTAIGFSNTVRFLFGEG
jgi:predicted TIM-barrel fold metal-dependent hydrolase